MARNTRTILEAQKNTPVRHIGPLAVVVCLLPMFLLCSPVSGQIIVTNDAPLGGDLYAESGRITVYERDDRGDATPQRIIEGNATGLFAPISVAVDLENHELFVLNNGKLSVFGSVTVYDLDDDGNESPKRTLDNPSGPYSLVNPEGIAVDPINDELYINEDFGLIHVFGRAAAGNATPLRTLNQKYGDQGDLDLDLVNDELFAVEHGGIIVYARTASGDDPPIREISGAKTGLSSSSRLVVDPLRDEIIVGGGSSIRVFSRSAGGNVEPLRVIEGPATGLSDIRGVALDPSSRTIFVSDHNSDAVLAFPQTEEGNVKPVRTIFGVTTQLDRPFGLAASGFLFRDGFESGNVDSWSIVSP